MFKSKHARPKIHVVSDLHVEFSDFSYGSKPNPDILVVAGDCGAGLRGLEWVNKNWPDRPVVCVAGNHEFYGEMLPTHRKILVRKCQGTNVHFLDRRSVEIQGVRFIGATLWTDFALDGNANAAMREAEDTISDYFNIWIAPGIGLSAEYVLREHELDRNFIETELAKSFDGPTIVVTHHAPSPFCSSKKFLGDAIAPVYASNLEKLIAEHQPAAWLHGHVHDPVDFEIGRTRILANPRGYDRPGKAPEGSGFRESLTIAV